MGKILWSSVLAVFLAPLVALGINDDLSAALQLFKAKFLSMAQNLSPEKKEPIKKDRFDIGVDKAWAEYQENLKKLNLARKKPEQPEKFEVVKIVEKEKIPTAKPIETVSVLSGVEVSAFPWLAIRTDTPEPQIKGVSQYCFGQQVNGTCMIWPWVNLKILETLVSKCEKYIQEEKNEGRPVKFEAVWGAFVSGIDKEGVGFWASHRLWWGRECEFLRVWNESFQKIVKNNFFENATKQGPVFPVIFGDGSKALCFHDENGNPLGKINEEDEAIITVNSNVNVLALLKRLMSVPYFFANRKITESVKIILGGNTIEFKDEDPIGYPWLNVPSGQDASGWLCYEKGTDELKTTTEEDNLSHAKIVFSLKNANMFDSKGEKKDEILGFKKIVCDQADVLALNSGNGVYSLYTTGLYKLVLLRLGLNSKNEEVIEPKEDSPAENKELWPVISAMRIEFNKGDKYKNPWSDYYMSKETLLEYHLAKIFKDNTELFDEAKKVCDFFFQTWEIYQKMINGPVYGKGGNPGAAYDSDTIKKYLPGPEQMMAMIVMRNVIGLWWGAMNPKAFYNALGIDKVGGDFKKDFIAKADSFILFWQKVVNELKKLPQKHFASFTSHGWVVSFDINLIKLQNAQPVDNLGLLEKLGIAGIESWHSKDLPTFYKKK